MRIRPVGIVPGKMAFKSEMLYKEAFAYNFSRQVSLMNPDFGKLFNKNGILPTLLNVN
jgi:hypothetical protein